MTVKFYQIKEDDLAVLEAELPRLLDTSYMCCNEPLVRKRWQIVKEIISNVRWDYGPPTQIERIPGGSE